MVFGLSTVVDLDQLALAVEAPSFMARPFSRTIVDAIFSPAFDHGALAFGLRSNLLA